MRSVDKDKMAVALKGASEQLRTLFLSNMSERAGKLLREEINALGPVRLRDVDEAQMYMVGVAKDLAEKGDIVISQNKTEDELVY
jgi:flagellar motor switch protein FliG